VLIAIEGIDGVGKTTACEALKQFGFFVFRDSVRHGAIGELSDVEIYKLGIQCNFDLLAFSRRFDFVADRWALSSVVYDGMRGYSHDLKRYLAASVWVFLLDCPVEAARRRVIERDGVPRRTLETEIKIQSSFYQVANEWLKLGGNLLGIETSDRTKAREELIRGVETALNAGILGASALEKNRSLPRLRAR